MILKFAWYLAVLSTFWSSTARLKECFLSNRNNCHKYDSLLLLLFFVFYIGFPSQPNNVGWSGNEVMVV